jgi:glycosyltransferase involved in cell wall biosynthesis
MFKGGKSCLSQCKSCALFRHGFSKSSREVDALVGVSGFVMDRITGAGYFPDAEHHVIYNAQLLPGTSEISKCGTVRFGYIGALTPPKGVSWLIDQFAADMGTLTIAGTGPDDYVSELKVRAAGKPIEFVGYVPSVRFFPTIDVSLVPSIWNDTLPGVAIEGSAYGRPVIASRRGGLGEIVRDGETGILVDPDRPDTLGTAMRALARDRSKLAAMALAAPLAVRKFTSVNRCLNEYEALYATLLSRGNTCDGSTDVATGVILPAS